MAKLIWRWLLRCGVIGCAALSAAWGDCPCPAMDTGGKPLRFEAVVEQTAGRNHQFARLVYDRGRFRVEHFLRPDDTSPEWVELYDGAHPSLVWAYNVRNRDANPSLESSLRAMRQEIQRLGDQKARERYGIPVQVSMPAPSGSQPSPSIGGMTLSCLQQFQLRHTGRDKLAGFRCDVWEGRVAPPRTNTAIRRVDTLEANPSHTVRAWIEPRTQLVLRLEDRMEFPPPSLIPPQRHGFVVKKLRLLSAVPAATFRLPPGTTAQVPRIFAGVPLPAGVKRGVMTGAFAGIGIDFTRAARPLAGGKVPGANAAGPLEVRALQKGRMR
jgi:hypothetical protein